MKTYRLFLHKTEDKIIIKQHVIPGFHALNLNKFLIIQKESIYNALLLFNNIIPYWLNLRTIYKFPNFTEGTCIQSSFACLLLLMTQSVMIRNKKETHTDCAQNKLHVINYSDRWRFPVRFGSKKRLQPWRYSRTSAPVYDPPIIFFSGCFDVYSFACMHIICYSCLVVHLKCFFVGFHFTWTVLEILQTKLILAHATRVCVNKWLRDSRKILL